MSKQTGNRGETVSHTNDDLSVCHDYMRETVEAEHAERIAQLEAENERLVKALKPLADTKARADMLPGLVAAIIIETGNGEWADWVCELVTTHAEAARQALEGEKP